MYSISEFKALIEEFSTLIHQQFFSDISPDNWGITSQSGSNYVYFGFKPDQSWTHMNIIFCATYDRLNHIITLDATRRQPKDETAINKTKQALIAFFHEKNMKGFLRTSRDYSSASDLIPLSSDSQDLLDIMNVLINKKQSYYSFSIYQAKHLHYQFRFDIEHKCIRVFVGNDESESITSVEEVSAFHTRIQEEIEAMKKAEERIISSIEQIDRTFYYTNQEFYLFNERVSFQIHKTFQKGKEKYRARFGSSYNQNLNLEKLTETVEKKAIALLKKKRVKAAIEGKTLHVFPKLMFKLHGKPMDQISWKYEVESSLTKDELNEYIFPKINEYDMKKLDKDYLAYFQYYVQMKNKGNRIDKVYQFADLYILLSPSKHFFLTEKEFLSIDLSLRKWRKKEDKERTAELESWKEKTFALI